MSKDPGDGPRKRGIDIAAGEGRKIVGAFKPEGGTLRREEGAKTPG